jgi:predicted nucleic acid-binding protein
VRTAIDTNVISAIWSGEPSALKLVAQLQAARAEGALLISPAVFAELFAYPGATTAFIESFLAATGVTVDYRLEERVWVETGQRFAAYAKRRGEFTGAGPKRLVADFVIGSHALVQADRLLTLDAKVYDQDFPELELC